MVELWLVRSSQIWGVVHTDYKVALGLALLSQTSSFSCHLSRFILTPKPALGTMTVRTGEGKVERGMPSERPCSVESGLLSALSSLWIGLFSDINSFF